MDQNTLLSLSRVEFDVVLLDLDGTLVDSLADVTNALNTTLKLEALQPVTTTETKSMFGDGVLELLKRALRLRGSNERRAVDLVPAYLEHYESNALKTTRVYPGVLETLGCMVAAGFTLAVVTNKPTQAARLLVNTLGVAPFIKVIVGGDSAESLKPAPTLLQAALAHLSVEASRAVMVGDMVHDVVAARAAGVATVLVSYGYAQQPPCEIAADSTIDSFTDLPAALCALSDIRDALDQVCTWRAKHFMRTKRLKKKRAASGRAMTTAMTD